jgi:hypothetical protein
MLCFCVVVAFVFTWLGSSLSGHLVYRYCGCDGRRHASLSLLYAWGIFLRGRVCLRVVVLFVVFMVVAFVFAWSRSHLDELVSWLPKPILMLLEGSAA